jgi:hypothetical protein
MVIFCSQVVNPTTHINRYIYYIWLLSRTGNIFTASEDCQIRLVLDTGNNSSICQK